MHSITATDGDHGLHNLSVLYVEDDAQIREQLGQFLRRRVGTLYMADNGLQGLDAFRRYRPDIVVSDIRMPEMDGLEMAARIKCDGAGAPVILTSAFADTQYFLRSIDIGIDKYVLKPIRTEALEAALRRVAQALHTQSELRLAATVFHSVSEGILVVDPELQVVAMNPAFEKITGFGSRETVGSVVGFLDAPDRDPALSWRALAESGHGRREIPVRRKDASVFIGWVSADTVRGPDGTPVYVVFVLADISERKAAEEVLKRLNETLEARVRERTASLEQANRELEAFSYSVSHDLVAPLRGIDGLTRMLEDDFSDRLDELALSCLRRIRAGTDRMAQLIDDLLALARISRTSVVRGQCSLSAMVEEIAAELSRQEPGRDVQWIITPGIVADADPGLVRIALDNLLRNAWKFTGKRARARIEFGVAQQGPVREYFVRDDGAGFDDRYAVRLFAPFQRLHDATEFQGTGIGLAIVERIVRRHGGAIWAEAAVDQGASFHFTLETDARSTISHGVDAGGSDNRQ
jgi:PAS domain S-box-containing protein